jgi:hypothetical protein
MIMWAEIQYLEPRNVEEICKQTLCNNSLIVVGCRPIYKKDWNENKFRYIKDLVTDQGEMMNLSTYNLHIKQLIPRH